MKTNSIVRTITVALAVLILAMAGFALAEKESVYAESYKYKVTIYAGEQGTVDGGKKVWTREYAQNEHVTITMKSIGFKLTNDKYYDRGFKIAGHDNDEMTGIKSMSFDSTRDVEYVITYGIKGAMVKYVAEFVDTEGNQIHDSETYYGMAGDKPVVAFKYIDGWTPDTYNRTKTLSKDESKNAFRFVYTKGTPEENQQNQQNQGNQNNPNANPAANPAVGPAAPGTPQNPAGTNVDDGAAIDDGNTPQANPGNNGDDNGNNNPAQIVDDDPTPTTSPINNSVLIGGGIALLLLLLALILFLIKKKKKEQEEQSEE